MTTENLATAQLGCSANDQLQIIFRRSERTAGRRSSHRDQVLNIPLKPVWLAALQKRFYTQWREHRAKIKSSFPGDPLLLPDHHHSNRPLCTEIALQRIYLATQGATGQSIPIRILRQTCGHLHSLKQDASILSRLGWSPQFAFHYTWLPRTYFKSTATG